jgi:hypothetical protein
VDGIDPQMEYRHGRYAAMLKRIAAMKVKLGSRLAVCRGRPATSVMTVEKQMLRSTPGQSCSSNALAASPTSPATEARQSAGTWKP